MNTQGTENIMLSLFDHLPDRRIQSDRDEANQKPYGRHESTPVTNTLESARAAADEAIERGEANADPNWKAAFLAALEWCAARMPEFTADDVWERLESLPSVPDTPDPRASGSLIRQAARDGIITYKSNVFQPSRRRHGTPIRVYQSRIYDGDPDSDEAN